MSFVKVTIMYEIYYSKSLPITLEEDETSVCEDVAAPPEIYIKVALETYCGISSKFLQ